MPTYYYATKHINSKHLSKIPIVCPAVDQSASLSISNNIAYNGCSSLVFSKKISQQSAIVKLFKVNISTQDDLMLVTSIKGLSEEYSCGLLFQMRSGKWLEYKFSANSIDDYNECCNIENGWVCKTSALFMNCLNETIKSVYLYSSPKCSASASSELYIGYFALINGFSMIGDGIKDNVFSMGFKSSKKEKYNGKYKVVLEWKIWDNYYSVVKCMQILM